MREQNTARLGMSWFEMDTVNPNWNLTKITWLWKVDQEMCAVWCVGEASCGGLIYQTKGGDKLKCYVVPVINDPTNGFM